ncbi:3-hydroxyisobutyryl-CoA hydrolase [Ephemeroptericola cinctiostellae]|nr:3-hydroxyisobutyryl-CoA hydrolase [Ephemeroptericola cinctiostellae]
MSEFEKSTEEITFTVENHVGVVTLHRPTALNALSFQMICAMRRQLLAWQTDDRIAWVLVRSDSPRAFCAGGDVRALYEMADDLLACETYFIEEYRLNHLTHFYTKPYVALMDGIVMGGGMGIAQGAGLRIVSENSRLAMPETAIGMVPDVGGSYFLSRTHDDPAIGRYLALTGTIINATDACHWRLADAMVAQSVWPHLTQALIDCVDPTWAGLRAVTESFARGDLYPAFEPMSAFESLILEVFDEQYDLAEITARLRHLSTEESTNGRWAANALAQVSYNSPIAMRLALHNQHLGRAMSLADCLRLEFNCISNLLRLGEAPEGIRAKIVDKDGGPNWHVTDVEQTFEQLKTAPYPVNQHPLFELN